MLVLRLLVMVLTIICLMDGHAEVSSSITGMRNGGESPAAKQTEPEVQILDRKKKKKPKPGKKKPKPGKKKPKPNKTKPKPTKPDTTTPTISTSTLKTTTITTTATTTTTTTVSPTTTATTVKTTSSTASVTTTLSTATSTTTTATTTVATSSTISTTTTTIPSTARTSSPATIADSGAGGECKATNGKPCIFPYKDGNEEYNECKNEGGKYFWCATAVYDSGKYKHWSYCSTDGPCPLEGDGECRATNNKPCVFPFKDGKKEYNECADFGGKYFWCATGTNSAGKYTTWSECPKDGSCPLLGKGTTLEMTSTATTASTTTPNNVTSAAASAIANVENTLNEINDTLQNLETAGFSEDEKQLLETMNDISDYLESSSITRNFYDPVKINSWTQKLYSTTENIKASKEVNPGFISAYQTTDARCSIAAQNAKLSQVNAGPGRMFQLHTISKILGIVTNIPSSSACCAECKILAAESELFEHSSYHKQCDCYKTKSGVAPKTMSSSIIDSGVCQDSSKCQKGTTTVDIKNINTQTRGVIGCKDERQYRCYAYNGGHGKNWRHKYMYHTALHLPLFSITRITHDYSFRGWTRTGSFKTDDYIGRHFKYCGARIFKPTIDQSRIPSQAEYNKQDEDRGHLVASEMFNLFFPGTEAQVRAAAMFMSNIWPQDPKCNRNGIWRQLENLVVDQAKKCVNNHKAVLHLFHGLMPSETRIFGKNPYKMPIQWVDAIYTSYCCLSNDQQTVYFTSEVIITNPYKDDGEECSEKVFKGTHTAGETYAKYLEAMKTSQNTRVRSNLFDSHTEPFRRLKNYPQCVLDFKDDYEFPNSDHFNG